MAVLESPGFIYRRSYIKLQKSPIQLLRCAVQHSTLRNNNRSSGAKCRHSTQPENKESFRKYILEKKNKFWKMHFIKEEKLLKDTF